MAKDFLPNHAKKANKNYAKLFKLSSKLKKFDVNGISILDQILNRLEENKGLEVIDRNKAFDSICLDCEKLKTIAFLFESSNLDEYRGYDFEIKSGSAAILEGIAENIEKMLIIFANKEKFIEVKI